MIGSLAEKVAIVTGAAGGIGEGHAKAIAAAGASVMIADIDSARGEAVASALRSAGHKAGFVAVDISSDASVQAAVDQTLATFGQVDFLVNNAALFGGMKVAGLIDMEMSYYRRFMDINFHGCLLTARAVVPHMKRQGSGVIINQSSTAAYMSMGPYSVAKSAMNAITFSLARELGPFNIRVNGIAPGPTDTQALRDLRAGLPADRQGATVDAIPLRRMGMPADIANAAVFLLSEKASWITGHVLSVDGGQWMRI